MTDTISNPVVVKRQAPTPSIEVDNDEVSGEYAEGAWEDLVGQFTAKWVKEKQFAKPATVWMFGSSSCSFGHAGYSVFVAQYGLPMSYFKSLKKHLEGHLGRKVRLSDYVQPSRQEGWRPRIHVQDIEAWTPQDAVDWGRVDA